MTVAIQPDDSLVIVGMDAAWAGCDGLDAFEQLIYTGGQQFAEVEGGKTALSPAACESLLGKVARRALQDAGLENSRDRRVAALVAGPEALAGATSRWDWVEVFTDLSGSVNPLAEALGAARQMLESQVVSAVVFAAVSGSLSLPPDGIQSAGPLGFDREVHGWRLGEGAGAVVLMQAKRASAEDRRVYARIRSMAASPEKVPRQANGTLPVPPALDEIRSCIQAALDAAQFTAGEIGYVEAFACGVDAIDGLEIAGLVQTYRRPVQDLTTAMGSVQANSGYLGPAAGLAGLVRAALCLYHREIPGVPGWASPKLPALWRGAPFYVPTESRAWFQKTGGTGRLAGLNVIGLGGSVAHLVLGEPVDQPVRLNLTLAQGGFYLFPITGNNQAELAGELAELRQSLAFATDLGSLAVESYAAACHGSAAESALALVIAGHNHTEISREIELALNALPVSFDKGLEWQTPVGSYFTPLPAGREGGVALVYPGAFNSYPGVGKDLFRLFPTLHQRADGLSNDMGRVMRERMLYPRSLTAISKEEMAALETKLLADPIAMLISGSAMAVLYTHILGETFGIHPQAAFGYSLGENSMLYATGAWGQGDAASSRLEESEAFRVRLAGPQQAVREYWGLPPEPVGSSAPDSIHEPLWSNYLVMSAPEKVHAVIEKEPRVYLTHINTPRQVVIGGDPTACRRVLAELHGSSIQAPFDYALHCAPMRSEVDALAELHNWPVESDPGLALYTAADYAPLPLDQRAISKKIAHMLTAPLDFPRLIRRVYADGARIFIEAGAGGNCARWVDETLKGETHLALSLNRRGTDDYTTLVRVLARLYSHRVPLDLSPLYQNSLLKVTL
jgi:PfaB family protein